MKKPDPEKEVKTVENFKILEANDIMSKPLDNFIQFIAIHHIQKVPLYCKEHRNPVTGYNYVKNTFGCDVCSKKSPDQIKVKTLLEKKLVHLSDINNKLAALSGRYLMIKVILNNLKVVLNTELRKKLNDIVVDNMRKSRESMSDNDEAKIYSVVHFGLAQKLKKFGYILKSESRYVSAHKAVSKIAEKNVEVCVKLLDSGFDPDKVKELQLNFIPQMDISIAEVKYSKLSEQTDQLTLKFKKALLKATDEFRLDDMFSGLKDTIQEALTNVSTLLINLDNF